MDSYKNLEYINKGSYSKVYKAVDQSNSTVAIKIINLISNEGIPPTALREIYLLRKFNNKNIIQLKNVLMNNNRLFLIFEYCDYDLMIYISHYPQSVYLLYKDILLAVDHIHKRKIIHRDLKPQNILVNSKGEVKIADFGSARSIEYSSTESSNDVVTLNYRAPELLRGVQTYSYYIDMWSIGCIFYEMVVGSVLFNCFNEQQLEKSIAIKSISAIRTESYARRLSCKLVDAIVGCLNVDCQERITAEKMLKIFY